MDSNNNVIFNNCISIEDELDILIRQINKEKWEDVIINLPSSQYTYFVKKYFNRRKFRFIELSDLDQEHNKFLPFLKVNNRIGLNVDEGINCYLFYQTILNKRELLTQLKSSIKHNFITFSNIEENDLKMIKDEGFKIQNRYDFLEKDLSDAVLINDPEEINSNHIVNREIRIMFLDTFLTAKDEIDIISPWISDTVVDSQLISVMEDCLKREVKIKILYGIGDASDVRNIKSDEIAQILKDKFVIYGDLFKIKKSNIHYKLLICDLRYALTGSYNFLSFRGEYDGVDDRQEGADIITNRSEIRNKRIVYFNF